MTVSLFKNPTPPKSTNSRNPNPRYKFKLNQNLNFDMYHEIPRNLSFSIWRSLEV